jgi:hypothetical protein
MVTEVLLYNNHAATMVIEGTQINHSASLNTSTMLSLFREGQTEILQGDTIFSTV